MISSGKVINLFLVESNNQEANSSLVTPIETAKSGLPTSPKKIVSPDNTDFYFPFSSINKNDELSGVWPGVCNTLIVIFPNLKSSLSLATIISKADSAEGPKMT